MASSQTSALPRTRWKAWLRTTVLLSLAAVVLFTAAVNVYRSSFMNFAEWDDEGYVMIGLRSFLQGNALYDSVYSQYGPFYYVVEGSLYTLLHLPVTHDAVRASVAVFWLLSAVLCAWAAYWLTRSWILAGLGFTAAIRLLIFFTGSPGHPEEICLVVLLGILVSASYLSDRAAIWKGCLLGALIAALTLTKINIGAFAALAIGLALLKAMPSGTKQRALFALIALAGLSLPAVILAPLVHQQWAQKTAILLVLSISAALLVAWCTETEQFVTPPLWVASIVAFGVIAVLVVAIFLARGTTLFAMLYSTVLQYREFAKSWYLPFPVRTEVVPVLSLMLAIAWVRWSASSSVRKPIIVAFNIIKVFISVAWCFYLRIDQWPAMYNFLIPFSWLVLVPATADTSRKSPFARLALCLLTVLCALYILPVAGAQMAFSLVLTIPLVCVFLDDAKRMLVTALPLGKVVRIVEIAAVVLLLATNAFWARGAALNYRRLKPLLLPGAEQIHIKAKGVATYRGIRAALQSSCDSYFSMPGIFSLYFWTNTAPPTRLLMSNWIGLLNQTQQQQVVNDLSRVQRLCIVYNPRMVKFWRRGQDLSVSPLARYIYDGFAPSTHVGDYVILVRRDQIPR
jgi:hypothetical protein